MISRATGLTQPAPASKTDREISDDTLATLDGQYSYRSYMDQGYEEWFVNEDGIPSTWTQAATRTEGEKAPISIMDMAGIDFSLKIEDGEVVQGDDEEVGSIHEPADVGRKGEPRQQRRRRESH